jgi:chromosome segregation protein
VILSKEKELHVLQQSFNELVQTLRTRENEKNLATQRLQYLREREEKPDAVFKKAEGQMTGIEESITFTQKQIEEEEDVLQGLTETTGKPAQGSGCQKDRGG